MRRDGNVVGGWWHETDEADRVICDLCPRACNMKPGDRGFCFVRENCGGEVVLTTYGRSTGFCVDPIEKKPLNHFYPGTSVLSFGTAGCNLGCKFCQNWDISKSREVRRLSEEAAPETIAVAASRLGCRSVAFTYNDPVIWAEYAIDSARECRKLGIKTVAVTAGYISPEARGPFFHSMDAANVDLKAFTEDFYYRVTYSHIQPVLETLQWLKRESDVWVEITNLVIPQANDSMDEIRQMCQWLLEHMGDEVPVHFTAFHPDFRMTDRPNTPLETLLAAYDAATRQGLKYVYVGNVNDVAHQSTYCPGCGRLLIERDWHQLGTYRLDGNRCARCNETISGHFDQAPGNWGRRRLPVRISQFAAKSRAKPQQAGEIATMETRSRTEQGVESAQATRPVFDELQEAGIHRAACSVVAAEVCGRAAQPAKPSFGKSGDQIVMGAFVTLKRRGRLRGCCGVLGKPTPLSAAVQQSAARTATQDMRLPPISPTELAYLDVDVSLLHSFQPVTVVGRQRIEQVQVGRHGLTIQRGQASGLLLPSVASELELSAEQFLRQVCLKAGLPTTAWEEDDTRLQTFESYSISAPFDSELAEQAATSEAFLSSAQLAELAAHCQFNVHALVRGATPNYYLPGCIDGDVAGVAVTVGDGGHETASFAKLSLRPGVPLQATLFTLCEAAARYVANRLPAASETPVAIELTILTDTAMHGTVADPDLRGLDPAQRALMVRENAKSAWVFEPQQTADELLETAARAAEVTSPENANVLSFQVHSTAPRATIASVPRPQAGAAVRPCAVAGSFYPADAAELRRMVDGFLGQRPERPERWPAIMVPHAGLVYSGAVAAAVFRQVEIPPTLIVIGPKHTMLGVEWAVTPHETWQLPGGTLAADPQLAQRLAARIAGLKLDAAAHRNEHAIEVELPLIARLAPATRVVGIAIGAGSLDRCVDFATGLADVIRGEPRPPLLVVSSDMNHYAPDQENRRLDAIAMSALERLDPADVLQTVRQHGISMCGVLPAVIVLETLRQLGTLHHCRRVAYATSAEVSGDTSRVVGYAGMLFG